MCAAAPAGRVSRTNWVVAIVLTGYHRQTTAAIQGRSPRRSSEPRIVRAPCSRRGSSRRAHSRPRPRSATVIPNSGHFAEVVRGGLRRLRPQRDADRLRPPRQSRAARGDVRQERAVESVPVHRERAGELHLSARMRVGRMDFAELVRDRSPPNQPSAANTACWTRGSRSRAESRSNASALGVPTTPSPYAAATRSEIGATRSWRTASSTGMAASGRPCASAASACGALTGSSNSWPRRAARASTSACADVSRPTGGRSSRLARRARGAWGEPDWAFGGHRRPPSRGRGSSNASASCRPRLRRRQCCFRRSSRFRCRRSRLPSCSLPSWCDRGRGSGRPRGRAGRR